MELLQLMYFTTVAETENISKAAKIHMIPQPDMSRTISKLESELDTQLFARTGNKIFLNEKGRLFYRYAKKAIEAIDDAKQAILTDDIETGCVKLLVLENRRITTECIVNFKKEHPNITFSACHNLYSDTYTDFDLCISSIIPVKEDLKGSVMLRENIAIAVNSEHKFASLKEVSPDMLKDESFIFLPPNNSVNKMASAYCLENGFVPNINIICDDPFYIRKYISMGFGIAFVPTISWSGLFDENIRIIPLSGDGIKRETSVYWHSDKYISSAVDAFRTYLINNFRKYQDIFTQN